jgi:heme/copper-type cytochrome/quinol oxidase subunit 2
MTFQTPATQIMDGIIDLHHDIMTFLVGISIFVCFLLYAVLKDFTETVAPSNPFFFNT